MTFKIIARFLGTCRSSLYQLPFGRAYEQISVCMQLRLSIMQINSWSLRSGRIAVERSAQVSEFVFTCLTLV